MESGTGDAIGASIEDSTNVTVGKGNRQQVVHVDARGESHERSEYLYAMLERRVTAIEIALQIKEQSISGERMVVALSVGIALVMLAINIWLQVQH